MTESDPTPDEEARSSSVNEVARSLERVYGNTLFGSRKRDLEIRLPAALPAVAMPASALKQVLLNLMRNAAEALPEGCRLSITSPGVLIANGTPSIELRVVDNGPGLPEDDAERIFEAFFTRKAQGTGLGLAIVQQIVSDHEGGIEVARTGPQGTSFEVTLPACDPPNGSVFSPSPRSSA